MGILDFLDNVAKGANRVVTGVADQVNPFDNGKSWGNPQGPPKPRIRPGSTQAEINLIRYVNPQMRLRPPSAYYPLDSPTPWGRPMQYLPMEYYRNRLPIYTSPLSDIDLGA